MNVARRPVTKYREFTITPDRLAKEYDVIVIGAGIGGLVCGSYLAKSGAKVLMVEQHTVPGGLCSFFKRKEFYFDAGANYFGGIGDPKTFGGMILRGLDLDVQYIQLDPVFLVHFPDLHLALPASLESHIELLQRIYPAEKENIPVFFREMLQLYRHFYRGKKNSELLTRYASTTYQEVLNNYFQDDGLKAVVSATTGYIGRFPNQISVIGMASMMMSYFYDGGFITRYGSQALPDSLMRRFVSKGGHLLLNTAVKRIKTTRNCANGVVLESGQEIAAPIIVSNADARQTFFDMVDDRSQIDSKYLDNLQKYRESISCFILFLGLKCDDDFLRGKQGWYFQSYDMHDYDRPAFYIAVPTLYDKSLAPENHHVLSATTGYVEPPLYVEGWSAEDRWKEYKERCEIECMARLEKIIPGITEKIVLKEAATRRTIYRYTLNSYGAMYGWEMSPDQFGENRLPTITPIENLYLCGHWTSIGSGVVSVSACGFHLARAVLQRLDEIKNLV
jgi:phytoene dehydrogenase-like protein